MILSRGILPEKEGAERSLYYRAEGGVAARDGMLVLQPGARVRFDTYFNGFFYPKYRKYTQVRHVAVHVRFSGELIARVICKTPEGTRVLSETVLRGVREEAGSPPVQLDSLPGDGMLYCAFDAQAESTLAGITYEAAVETPDRVRVAAIICTYHREGYVRRNLERIHSDIWSGSSPIQDGLDVIVVDNGGTLTPYESGHVRVVPNRNLGGSGGFCRGMLEALACGDRYTHVLLMDDDIRFEPEVFVRTVQLLKVLQERERQVCIGGQMLLENAPTVQYEAGGCFRDGRLWPVHRGTELSEAAALLENERESEIHYNAWWYCCMPLALIREKGLPLPLFIKEDDVEYGLRSGAEFLLLDGIGVWHKDFAEKESAHLEYYVKRNELIVSAIYSRGDGIFKSLWKLFCALGGAILREQTERIRYIRWGYRDFLRGPDFFLTTDAEELNRRLLEGRERRGPSRIAAVFQSGCVLVEMSFRFLARYHAVQRAFIRSQRELTSEASWRERLGLGEGERTDAI